MNRLLQRLRAAKYNPAHYWNSRENPNNAAGEQPERVRFDVEFISRFTRGVDAVMELGPGVGRTFTAYDAGQRVVAVDLSRKYADRVAAVAAARSVELQQVFLDRPGAPLPFADASFAIGVSCQVLLHVPPAEIVATLRELVRVCRRVVVVTAYTHGVPTRRANVPHVFNHDYWSIVTELGCEVNHLVATDGRIYCVIDRKEPPLG